MPTLRFFIDLGSRFGDILKVSLRKLRCGGEVGGRFRYYYILYYMESNENAPCVTYHLHVFVAKLIKVMSTSANIGIQDTSKSWRKTWLNVTLLTTYMIRQRRI